MRALIGQINEEMESLSPRRSIAAKLIVPLVLICFLITLLLDLSFSWTLSNSLHASLDEKCQNQSRDLAAALTDPLSIGAYDEIQNIINVFAKSDRDMLCATLVAEDGTVIASTNKSLKDKKMSRDLLLEQSIETKRHGSAKGSREDSFAVVVPVQCVDAPAGMLAIEYSTERVIETIRISERYLFAVFGLALLLGISIYAALVRRSILRPIASVVGIASLVSHGNLPQSEPIASSRHENSREDEIGKLLTAMHEMVRYLRRMANTADAIASGDVDVPIEPASEADIFGNAFKKMVDTLYARKNHFRSLCQASPVGIFETDAQGNITFGNPRLEELYGVDVETMVGQPWHFAIHREDLTAILANLDKITPTRGETPFTAEFRIVRPTGEVLWTNCLIASIQLKSGALSGFVGTIKDITNRKTSEMAQYELSSILSVANSVEEAAPRILQLACKTLDLEAALLWKAEGDLLKLEHVWHQKHQGSKHLLDLPRTCLKTQGLAGLVSTIGRPMWMDREHLKRNWPQGSFIDRSPDIRSSFACPVQVRDRISGVLEFHSRAINELSDQVLESYSSVAFQLGQFSERIEAERFAKQLIAVVECSDDAIISCTLSGKILSWNNGAKKMFGYELEEVLGTAVGSLVADGDRRKFLREFQNAVADLHDDSFEVSSVKNDGSVMALSVSISPVKSENNEVVSTSIIARDITHKKAVEERMREFYAIVSHELRTPLTSIRGALSMISTGIVEPNSQEGLELINLAESGSVRLVTLINDILDLKKIEAGNLELNFESVQLDELLEKSVESMRGLALQRNVTIDYQCPRDGEIFADKERIIQVLTNLISNAIKYSDCGAEVRLTVDQAEETGFLRFSVIDTGEGIPHELQHKLFGKFQQIDSSDRRAKEGSGLGLAIAKAIVEAHGGTIGAISEPGKGSTFWFELRSDRSLEVSPLLTESFHNSAEDLSPLMNFND